MKGDLGDFQTPPGLVAQVLHHIEKRGRHFSRVLEPTCGKGNFITELLQSLMPPNEIYGIEIQRRHFDVAHTLVHFDTPVQVFLRQANFFDLNLKHSFDWQTQGSLLIVGNPPWITNATLGSLDSQNIPQKMNFKQLRGIDAMTGCSNFDIAESIWLKLITELIEEQPTIALLCKMSVARNVIQHCYNQRLPVCNVAISRINAKKWFDVAVDACLLCLDVGCNQQNYRTPIYPDLLTDTPESWMDFQNGYLVANVLYYQQFAELDGCSDLIWRQGIKHDAASVMELTQESDGCFLNKFGERVVIEEDYVYPLLKGSDIAKNVHPSRFVIVPQRYLSDDTQELQYKASSLWAYLVRYAPVLDNRKSSIYKNQPRFALFGIGDYTFAPYKVAISGFHKKPIFRAIVPVGNKPVMLDDTCYFVPMQDAESASVLVALLNDEVCLRFLEALMFTDAKRPITKKLLQRVNIAALVKRVDVSVVAQRATEVLQELIVDVSDVKVFDSDMVERILSQLLPSMIHDGLGKYQLEMRL